MNGQQTSLKEITITQQVIDLQDEGKKLQDQIRTAKARLKEVNKKLRSIESADKARVKKLQSILGEGQKGVAE